MSKPDEVVAHSPLTALEVRMGIPPLEGLLAERDVLVKQVAELRAKHGNFGTWDHLRKIELEKIAAVIRAKAVADSVKITEAALDEAAHADMRYVDFVTEGTLEKARWIELENQIQGIEDVIRRGNTVASYLAAEARL